MIARADRGGDRLGEDVAVADVAELVRDHAASSSSESSLVMPAVTATAACLGLRPGGERVRLVAGDHVEARHRQAGAVVELAHHLVELRGLASASGFAPADREGDLVAEPVGAEVHQQGDDEEDRGAADAADQPSRSRPAGRRGRPSGSWSGGRLRSSICVWSSFLAAPSSRTVPIQPTVAWIRSPIDRARPSGLAATLRAS